MVGADHVFTPLLALPIDLCRRYAGICYSDISLRSCEQGALAVCQPRRGTPQRERRLGRPPLSVVSVVFCPVPSEGSSMFPDDLIRISLTTGQSGGLARL